MALAVRFREATPLKIWNLKSHPLFKGKSSSKPPVHPRISPFTEGHLVAQVGVPLDVCGTMWISGTSGDIG